MAINKVININNTWADVRQCLSEFPLHFYPEKTIELLNTCRANRKLRYLFPYISLGRLGLHCYEPSRFVVHDYFLCIYFYDGRYVVSTYNNERKWFFENAGEAIGFVVDNLN
ncbi:DUF6193 family natural product biosynthesis protein [Hymenobacter sp. UYP22]|uniref:DUF6193 family natural product biosynthesis protein n=1 Tax=Hymenobacter sp. UYP22 TaxID=3156348 RepID=UPI00339A1E57